MKRSIIILSLIMLLFTGCGLYSNGSSSNDSNGAREIVEQNIGVGQSVPSPSDVGVDYYEPRDRKIIEGNNWQTFSNRWNDASESLQAPGLKLENEVWIRYAVPSISFEYEIAPYLVLFGSICYDTKELRYAAIDWELSPEIDGELIANSWSHLIYASNPDMTGDDLMNIIDELGIYELTPDDLADYEDITVINNMEYDFYSTSNWGEFTIRPVD